MRTSNKQRGPAKAPRPTLTPEETALWGRLQFNQPGYPSFGLHQRVGPYVLDFYCAAARLAVEIYPHPEDDSTAPPRDAARERYLTSEGIRLLRYPVAELQRDSNEVAAWVWKAANAPAGSPPPYGPAAGR